MARAGFTLLELLVVLAVLALIAGLAVPMIGGTSDALEVKRGAQSVAAGLRRSRAAAIASNREAQFTLNVEERWFRAAGRPKAQDLSAIERISVLSARSTQIDGETAAIRFFPDGSSTGGRIELASGGQRGLVVVDWLTGRVSRAE